MVQMIVILETGGIKDEEAKTNSASDCLRMSPGVVTYLFWDLESFIPLCLDSLPVKHCEKPVNIDQVGENPEIAIQMTESGEILEQIV